jgi:hypothetical protein
MSVAGGILDFMTGGYLPETGGLASIVTSTELMSAGISSKQIRTRLMTGSDMNVDGGVSNV